jgi:TRAP-type C4-dicarboxylate transport system substrate-binding protein
MSKKCLCFVMVLAFFGSMVLLGLFAGATMSAAAPAKDVIKARFSYQYALDHYSALMSEKYAKMIKEESGGRVEITTFGNATLYNSTQIAGALGKGVVEMGAINHTQLVSFSPDFMIEGLWFFYTPTQLMTFWTDVQAGRDAWAAMEKKINVKRVAWIPIGPYCLATKKPVKTLEDISALTIRYVSKAEVPNYKALNMKNMSIETQEVYTALERNMINAVLTIPSAVRGQAWWDYTKYVMQPYVSYQGAFIGINNDFWNRLPNDLKEIFLKVGEKISKEAIQGVIAYSDDILKELVQKKGGQTVTMSPAELNRVKQQLQAGGAYDDFRKQVSPVVWDALVKHCGWKGAPK